MNQYLLALIGLVVMFVVGFIVYRLFFGEALAAAEEQKSISKILLSVIGLYLVALGFIWLYDATLFPSGIVGMAKGLQLGFMVGVFGFVLPILIDGSHFRGTPAATRAVAINWFVSFITLGLLVGALS